EASTGITITTIRPTALIIISPIRTTTLATATIGTVVAGDRSLEFGRTRRRGPSAPEGRPAFADARLGATHEPARLRAHGSGLTMLNPKRTSSVGGYNPLLAPLHGVR